MTEGAFSRTAASIAAIGVQQQEFSAEPGAHYDRVTDAWQFLIGDDLHVGYFEKEDWDLRKASRELTRLLANSAQLKPGSEVLDLGCGTGNPAINLALEYGCRVTAVSNSVVGIERTTARAAARGAENRITFCVTDACATGCADQSFDCVWVMESSHLMPRKDLLIKECARVLRPGGAIVLCDLILRRAIPAPPGAALCHDLMLLEKVYGKASLYSLESYLREFEAHGLEAKSQDISEQVLPTFAHWRKNAEKHAARVSEMLGPEQLALFTRSCDILTRLFRSGQLGYGLVTDVRRS